MKALFFFLICSTLSIKAQEEILPIHVVSDCAGAIDLPNSGNHLIAFTGNNGNVNDFYAYSYLNNLQETNSLFLKFTAPHDGSLYLNVIPTKEKFQLIIFKNTTDNIVEDIFDGKALIINSPQIATSNAGFLIDSSYSANSPHYFLKKDEVLMLVLNTGKNKKHQVNIEINFKITTDLENPDKLKKIIDERKNSNSASMEIQVRDAETDLPIVADVMIKDKKRSQLYKGSDFFFNCEKSYQITIKCNATGYFFAEEKFKISADSSKLICIQLQSMSKGKSMKIDKLQFVKGSFEIYPGSEATLLKVKDFLLLNADLKIEIQGHVNNEGKNDMSSKMLSRKRAKQVRNFFVGSGVEAKRLSWKACSNKFPIYPNPKNEQESQDNRRVEIKVL